MIYEVGAKVVTLSPEGDGETIVEEAEGENDNLDEKTPQQQNVKKSMASTSDAPYHPYETPVVLRTKPWAPSVVPDDTETDDSELERMISRLKEKKAAMAQARVSSEDNLNTVDN